MLLNGIDQLEDALPLLRGQRVALLTHNGATTIAGQRSIEAMLDAGVNLTLLMAPEHGLTASAAAGEDIADGYDCVSDLPCFSLYGNRRKEIPAEVLDSFDILAADLSDVGVRYYTYPATLFSALDSCAAAGKGAVIFDRANPLGSEILEGPILEIEHASIVGRCPVPVRHGMTLGRYAEFAQRNCGVGRGMELNVISPKGLSPAAQFPEFGRPWHNPSPNLRSFDALLLYPGTCLLEGTNLSEGRGTSLPFQTLGAPWLRPDAVLDLMPRCPGVRFITTDFTPTESKFAGQNCAGLTIHIHDRHRCSGFEIGLWLIDAIRKSHPDDFNFLDGTHFDRLLGSSSYRLGRESCEELLERAKQECQDFIIQTQL